MKLLTSRLGVRLFISLTAITFGVAALVGFWFERAYSRRVVAEIRSNLSATAALLAAEFRNGLLEEGSGRLDGWVKEMGRASGYRITVIASDGMVLADSDEDPARMENHGKRPEILEAMEKGKGESRRFSVTRGFDMLYLAEAIFIDGVPRGAIRVSVPETRVSEGVIPARRVLLWSLLVSFLLALLLAGWMADSVADPLLEMEETVKSIRQGDFRARVRNFSSQDLKDLGSAINEMAAELGRTTTSAREVSAKLDLALSALNAGLITVDAESRVVFWNESARVLLDWVNPPERGRAIEDLIRSSVVLEIERNVRKTGHPQSRETTLFRDGTERMLAVHGIPLSVEEHPGTMVVIQDITGLRFLERTRQDFVANASHELKTPLAVIKGYVDTLQEGVPDEATRSRFLGQLSANVDRLAALADDLLNLSRIESRRDPPPLEPLDGREIVRAAVERFRKVAERRSLRIRTEVPEEEVQVLAHGDSLGRILDHLLDNAVKYTREGTITVRLRREENRALFEIEDTGIGISEADLGRIFERFYRVDKARSTEAGGTGLGLSIVKHLATQIGATVHAESEIGSGSRFVVSLPDA
jgi:two-component system phosphate regulon sensor histidine kinase PhoR